MTDLDTSAGEPDPGDEAEAFALALEQAGQLAEAAAIFDSLLAAQPRRQASAKGRARIALRLREPEAIAHCRRALAFHAADPELQLSMIAIAGAELGVRAIPLFEQFVRDHPACTKALERLAEMRAEAGAGEQFADPFEEALKQRPDDKALLLAYARTLSRSGRHERALAVLESAGAMLREDREATLLEALAANLAGADDRAASALSRLDRQPDAQLLRAQHGLQTGQTRQAGLALEEVVAARPQDLSAWALLAVAWRLLGDPRHAWLCEQPGLCRTLDLDLTENELAALAERLREFHGARAEPIGQSVRGGTQTAGFLLTRPDPEIARLSGALAAAIRRYLAELPPEDHRHPLLRHRNTPLAFGGSWSVRLSDGGFHVPHLHPAGIISSAGYVRLPEVTDESVPQAGWLELGRPPPELNVDLPPIALIEPKPGRLVLFPSYLFHGTRPFAAGERLSVAFDVVRA